MKRRTAIRNSLAIGTLSILGGPLPLAAAENSSTSERGAAVEKEQLQFWLETAYRRVYPNSAPGNKTRLNIIAAKNEQVSFQACFKNLSTDSAQVQCDLEGAGRFKTQVRRVGFVSMQQLNTYVPKEEVEGIGKIPGLCPDPLFPEAQINVGVEANGVFWITLKTPADIPAGKYTVNVKLTLVNRFAYVGWNNTPPFSVILPVELDIRSLVIKPRKNFPVTNWISADSIWEYYKTEPCSDRFWELADKFIENIVAHGNNVVYTPIFNARHELLVRPAQLLKVKKLDEDRYAFDFSDVRKWVRLAMKHGAEHVEFTHFFTPAPTSGKYPQRIYERETGTVGKMLWPPEISATSDVYRNFLKQFIPEFKEFLEAEQLLDKAFFHCADEPDGAAQIADYKKARALLKELAPWMKVMDALSDPAFAKERITDMPVPSIVTAPQFTAAGVDHWVYYCCGPRDRYLQRLLDTPLSKIRMSGLVFYKLGAKGFLHWGYCYWFKFCTSEITDPFKYPDVHAWPGLPYGDPFVVYPGANGPLDSVRWEQFSEGLQDYALLQSAGMKPDDPLLKEIKDYASFPKTEAWYLDFRKKLLSRF